MTAEIYSPSRLSNFESCPKRFEYRYRLNIEAESESIEAFVGKRVHEVMERLNRVVARGRVPSLPRVLERFRALWDEHYDPGRVRVVREDTELEWYRENGERCLANYYRRHYPFDADETLGIEERLRFSLDEDGRYRMQGIVDRVVRARDGALEIHDYKTGARVPSQGRLDRDRQLALYQLGLRERYGDEQPIRLVWHYLLMNQERRSTRSSRQLGSLRKRTMRLIDRIRSETEFEARPGPLCGWCEYRQRCPAQQGSPRARSEAEPSEDRRSGVAEEPGAPPPVEGEPRQQLSLW